MSEAHSEEWLIEEEEAGIRIDKFLSDEFTEFSRGFIQDCIKDGMVELNGKSVKASEKLKENDHILFNIPEISEFELIPEDFDIPVIYEDEHIMVINKPAGLVIHPGAGNPSGTLVNKLMGYNEEVFKKLIDDDFRPGIVHRLDKETTGLLIVAKSLEAQNKLKAAFKGRSIKKTYLALVRGRLKDQSMTIDTWYGRDPDNRLKMAVLPEPGKEAISKYIAIARHNGVSLAKVRLETGRTHQIRVHMAYLGHTVIGDKLYAKDTKLEHQEFPDCHLLHAWKLSLYHPVTEEILNFTAPVPDIFIETAAKHNISLKQ